MLLLDVSEVAVFFFGGRCRWRWVYLCIGSFGWCSALVHRDERDDQSLDPDEVAEKVVCIGPEGFGTQFF